MPRLSTTGSAVTGVAGGTIGLNGSTPAALSGYIGGWWSFMTTNLIVGLAQPTAASPFGIYQYNISGASVSQLDANDANFTAAGGGVWAAWLAGNGVRTSIPISGEPLVNAGLNDVSEAGLICLTRNRAADSILDIYNTAGTKIRTVNTTLVNPWVTCRNGVVAYQDLAGWHLVTVATGQPVSGFVSRANILQCIPFSVSSRLWVAEYETTTGLWSVRPAGGGSGWVVQTPGSTEVFWMDAVGISSTAVRLAWSTGLGELPDELVTLDITLTTGATVLSTVSGGVLVPTTGPNLVASKFGTTAGSDLNPPIPHPVSERQTGRMTIEWQAWARKVASLAVSNAAAIAALPSPTPPSDDGVDGPGATTDQAVARWNGTSGTMLDNSLVTISDAGAVGFPDGVRQTFNPNGTNAGLNVGSVAGDPSTPSNGDLWYDSTANELTARINGVNVALAGSESWIPLVDGSEPPAFITDGAGTLILVAYP